MKKLYLILLSAFLVQNFTKAQNKDVYFASYPTLTPDGKTVIFSYEGDLWKTDLNSPAAVRLTAMPGEETNARVSPDSKWLAFSSNQFGNNDVFIMPMAGGEVKQLTFSDANDEVDSWSWDSKSIYFNSNRYNAFGEYKIGLEGGTPKRVFSNYFNTIHDVVEHPLTGELFFSDTWESNFFSNRKHYKGAYNPDIQSYNPKSKAYKQYTDWTGKDFWTTLDQKGNIYFVSDEGNGEYNLYTFVDGKKTPLTQFPTSIKRPFVSANGEKLVFEKDYQLFVYDVASKQSQKLSFTIFRNDVLPKDKEFNVQGKIDAMDVSPDGKKLAFVSRGELFVSDVEGKFVRQIERSNAERVTEVKWLPDSKSLIFNQTLGGYYNWYTVAADGPGVERQITNEKQNNRAISVNKEHTQAVYLSGREEVKLIDLKSLAIKTIAEDEIWGLENSQPYISPNGQYVVYTAHRNFESDIFVYDIHSGKTLNLTNSGVSESEPYWSPDGKYIYFSSSRLYPDFPYGAHDIHIYRMPLQKFNEPFRIDKFDDLFKEDKKDTAAKTKKKPLSEQPAPKAPAEIVINTEDLMKRMERIGPGFGDQSSPYVIQKGDKTLVYFSSNYQEGKWGIYRTTLQPFEDPKTEKITGVDTRGFDIAATKDKYYLIAGGNIYTLNIDNTKLDKIDISYKFDRDLESEFRQMFDEAWAGLEENYYDGSFHNTDWKKVHDTYSTFIPYLNNRADLRLLLNDMLGELNSSHQGFYSGGSEESKNLHYRTMETGIVFSNDDPYKVESVLKNSNADKADINIEPGDRLKEVNGAAVDEKRDRNIYFTKPSLDKELQLTFDRKGKEIKVKIHPEPAGQFGDDLYDEWIGNNRKVVTEKSKNRIAYVYMKNMGSDALQEFLQDMVDDAYKKDALILDLRYNTGGNVHDAVLQFLSQRPYLQWQYRGGQRSPQPNFAPSGKPIILLVNEQTLSDGEMTANGFKALGLGKVIGTETYRWIIFTTGRGLVDGSFYRIPAWGCYSLDGKDIEKTGVSPDIYVKTGFTDRLENKDPQLDRAIEEIMKQLK